jgi:4-amino-4-deoxy-L-arabinose transferase-like glycosyltransferase
VSRPRRALVLGLPAVVGAAVLLIVSRRGVYLSPDGLSYVGTARNLVDGHGLTPPPGAPPLGNFPPLYPLVLAAGAALGADPLTVARFLNPSLFGATILVVGLVARRLTGSLGLALAAQLLVLSGRDFLAYHSSALSEPLFVLLTLLAVVALAAHLEEDRRGPLLAASALAATACLTRYVGMALVAAGVMALVVLARRRGRWRGAVIFASVALVPLLAWLFWVRAIEGQSTNRTAVLHAPGLSYAWRGLENASRWLLPDTAPRAVRVAALAATVAAVLLAVLVARRSGRGRGPDPARTRVGAVLALFSLAYLLALVGDRLLFDVTGRLDTRFLLPLHAAALLLGLWALGASGLGRSRVALAGVGVVVGAQVVSGAFWVRDAATSAAVRPGGFAAPRWTNSRVIDEVRTLGPTTPVYTNDVGALFFHTDRVARPVPHKAGPLTGRPNPAYQAELDEVAEALRRGGVLLYFTAVPARRESLPAPAELAGRLGLEELTRDEVGRLYRMPEDQPLTSPAGARPR